MTKTKTTTKVGLAVAFLAIAASFAAGANRFSNRAQISTDRSVSPQATLSFCIGETAAVPVESHTVLSPEFFGIQSAQAAQGELVVQIQTAAGRQSAADVFIYDRNAVLIREVFAPGGEIGVGLEEGTYHVRAVFRNENLGGEKDMEVRAGRTVRYVIQVAALPTAPATAVGPSAEAQQVYEPGTRDLGQGTVKVVTGSICDRDNRVVNTSGIVTVQQGGEAMGMANVASGGFNIFDLPNGTYTLQFQHPAYGSIDRTVTLEPKRVNFQTR